MSNECAFKIYNASAGSGKTYTLVKEYLKILLKSKSPLAFKNILALTFTNKAVAEMKERIIKTLQEFSEDSILTVSNPMFDALVEDLGLEPEQIHQKSKTILATIVHNYASFDISTIDKFNHKLIRTFAYDLKLPLNFEVELDTAAILNKAVDQLIDKAGTDEALTKVLVDFAIEKADDDKSWDISYDFNAIAKLLTNENDIPYIETIKHKSLKDFKILKSILTERINGLKALIVKKAESVLRLISESGLEHNDFAGKNGLVPSYFLKLSEGDFAITFDKVWMDKIETHPLYAASSVNKSLIPIIDDIQPIVASAFFETKAYLVQYKFLQNALRNITPLSVLMAISNSLKELKTEDDLLLISEFNSLISNEIKNQPAPYIYERIGEKFKHFFIDEFQDTSVLQWKNLIPLIDNALSSENLQGEKGSAMVVGDAKQAIYRWRGGEAEQFIELYNDFNPFSVEKCVRNLPSNYRSLGKIVEFNNSFFSHLSGFKFSDENHRTIYAQSYQSFTKANEGYVNLSFLDTKNDDEEESKDTMYCHKVKEVIAKVLQHGFDLKDICIITRKSKEGVAIAEYLSSENIPVISSESLLLKNSSQVNFIMAIFSLATQPKNDQLKIEVLSYLADEKLKLEDKHAFFSQFIRLDVQKMFENLSSYNLYFDFKRFMQLPIYEAAETVVREFQLNLESNAYLQFFMDEVLTFTQKQNSSLSEFVTYWDLKKDKLSIVSPQGNDAVQIMTIHKSKGLEFPVVIFPFANQNIYFDMSPKTWFPVEEKEYNGFPYLYVNQNKDLADLGSIGESSYHDYRSGLELDTLNLLYVVMTRAIEQLFVVSELNLDSKQNENLNSYSGLFINYLKSINKWDNTQQEYVFGNPERQLNNPSKSLPLVLGRFISVPKEAHNLSIVTNSAYLWDTSQEEAQEKGNLVHNIMSMIKSSHDIDYVFEQFLSSGHLDLEQSKKLKPLIIEIVNHQNLLTSYGGFDVIYNEKDILAKNGEILRPDRVILNNKDEAIIIDYKTGLEKPSHKEQIILYASILEKMNIKVIKKILIYINEDIQIKEF